MPVVAILKRWLERLAALLLTLRETWRARHSLVVSRQDDRFTIRRARQDRDSVMAIVPAGTPVPSHVARAARRGLVILELPAGEIVVRRIGVPAQAREFLAGIVRNQMERLSPWPAGQAVYGFAAAASRDDGATLDVRVLITSRTAIDSTRQALASIGLQADRIVAAEPDASSAAAVPLWSRLADTSDEHLARARWQVGIAIAAAVGLSLGLSVWAMLSAAAISTEREDLEARAAALQRQLQAAHSPQALASLKPTERAWASKQTSPAAVIVLEALSRALPDSAYLTEFRLEHATLRISGLASDAPSLIAPLERSGHLTAVHFFAPTTRSPDGARFMFHIEAQVEPRLDVEGE